MLSPIVVSVPAGDGIALSLFGVCPSVGDLMVVWVFNENRETVLIELSEAERRMAILFFVDSVTVIHIGVCWVCTTRTRRGCVTGTLVFFFRLRPLPPRFPRLVFLLRTRFFFFLETRVVPAVSADVAHSGRTPAEAVCSAPANGLHTASALLKNSHCG